MRLLQIFVGSILQKVYLFVFSIEDIFVVGFIFI